MFIELAEISWIKGKKKLEDFKKNLVTLNEVI